RSQCGSSTSYLDDASPGTPSLGHYLAATSGSNCVTGLGTTGSGCITDNEAPSSHMLATTSIFDQASAAGGTWKAYQEAMPTNCALTTSGSYAVRHNPAAYYSNLAATACPADDVPFPAISCSTQGCTTPSGGSLLADLANGALPAFSFITPNLCNDT